MKILLAPDKFRGSLTAPEVCQAMTDGISMVSPDIEVVSLPMADGGEGTLDLLLWYSAGKKNITKVHDPLGRIIEAEYGLSADGKTAFIEMATASGLRLLKNDERNPLKTSTFGTGELIKSAIENGVENLIMGIGGSATNDAGIGMAAALGWQFLDELKTIYVACDVTNPLYGINGAAHVYAPQKGADADAVQLLDDGLRNIYNVAVRDLQSEQKGWGAAGGLGFGSVMFLGAELKEGVKLLMDFCDFDKHLEDVDLVITGEGKIDNQTLHGKLIGGITQKTSEKNIPIAAICGTLAVAPAELEKIGITYATSILNRPMDLDEALKMGYEGVRDTTYYLVKLLTHGRAR
ncbi:MAG: glycerate kinase [Spirosomaceae bacterium]|nr:glycerate kinase [Spirosomataceae bacterium]